MALDLLLEIGCEELPSSFVAGALAALPDLVCKRLDALRIAHGAATPLGSPRRIALVVEGLEARQPDIEEELVGPPATAAFDKEGKPTKGGEAFAKKAGVDVAALRVVETPKGKYVAATRKEAGRATIELLPKVLVEAIAAIPFRKSMRWGSSDVAFGRPIHWLVALLGGDVVSLSFAGVESGRTSHGHRFLAPAAIAIDSAKSYVAQLKSAHVYADVGERSRTMVARLDARARELGGVVAPDAFLTEENTGLVEEPLVVDGGFDEAFLKLPEPLILDVMRTHQRYFGVRDAAGKLTPRYLAVVNTAQRPDNIRRGNDRVMRARLSDARFFVETDRKAGLETYEKKLAGIRYHAKLGSVADKVARIGAASCAIAMRAGHTEASDIVADTALAARHCKSDLASLTVGEFPEMQGHAGRDIALASGLSSRVADAIAAH
ncbi:MAG: glycine--tRNA ligase subunit beta, partial [Polyangiales bacterium]